jgi:hypothetical protein
MAEKKLPAGGADFVAKIVKDPKNPPATLMLKGFLGASSEDKHTRIYFDPHLSSYAEIPNDAILHTQEVATEDGLGATHVWIARDAQLIYGSAAQERPKGTFLEGPIMQDHFAGTAAAAFPGTVQITHAAVCQPSLAVACPPRTVSPLTCPPFTVQHCPSLPVICNTPIRTVALPCLPRTIADPGCMVSAHVACPTFGACPSLACGIGGPIEMAQRFAPNPATIQAHLCHTSLLPHCPFELPQRMLTPTINPQGVVCPSHSPGCGGPGTATMPRYAPVYTTQWAYCTWFVCPVDNNGCAAGTVI